MTIRTKIATGAAVAALLAAGTATTIAVWPHSDKMTPCRAATKILAPLKGQDPAVIAAAEKGGDSSPVLLRGLITGDYPDVSGSASPELAGRLRAVADDIDGLSAGSEPGELSSGKTARDISALVAACGA